MFAYTKIMQGIQAVSAAVTDAYFNLVTLLLPGNGTNGAQNNTFLDSSTNNFTITRNGNTTQGTFSPFSQTGWSNYFNGSTDYLSFSDNAAFEVGSGDFTIEAWVNFSALPSTNGYQATIASKWGNATNQSYEFYLYNNAGTYQLYLTYSTNGSSTTNVGVNWTPTVGVWYHVACVRSGSNVYFFANGTQQGSTGSISGTIFDGNGTFQIGSFNGTANTYLNGYVSNWRLTKGGALYTSNFTPSTTPLTTTVSAGTVSLLTCQSNRFIDNSSNAFSITVNGTPSVQAFSPFAPTAAYDAATNGGSGYFDGTGDYLSVGAAADWAFMSNSTAAWTIECWIYNDTSGTETNYFVTNSGSTVNIGIFVIKTSSETVRVAITRGVTASYVVDVTTTGTLVKNAWNHLFVSYDQSLASSNCLIYINGASAGTGNKTANAPSSSNPATALYIGTYNGSAGFISGYVSSIRVSNSVRSVPSGVPTSPYTSDANTKLLANFTNAGITDATAKNDLETVGNAQISTTQSKFGGSSMYFDGTGDYLTFPSAQNLSMGSGDWTFEAWIYLANTTGLKSICDQNSGQRMLWYVDGTSLKYYTAGGVQITGGTLSATTWTHVALVRSSGSTKMYVNGTQVGSTYTDSQTYGTGLFVVGGNAAILGNDPMNGYIDDFRITKGYARYTANFTAPTAAFALQ